MVCIDIGHSFTCNFHYLNRMHKLVHDYDNISYSMTVVRKIILFCL